MPTMAFLLLATFTPMLQVLWPANRGAPRTTNTEAKARNKPAHQPEETYKSTGTSQDAKNEEEKVDASHEPRQENKQKPLIDYVPGLSKFKRPVTIWSQSSPTSHDVVPQFYIYRQDGTKVPLIPLDELPPGLKVGRQNWYHRFWVRYMTPASLSKYPKRGEYEVTIQTGTRLKPRVSRTLSNRAPPGRQGESGPILECCDCTGGNSCAGNTCIYSQHQSSGEIISLQSPLLTQRHRIRGSHSQEPFTPPNSLAADVSRTQSINKKDNAAEVDRLRLQRGLDRLARQQSPGSRSSTSDPPMGLLDLDSVKGTHGDGSVTPVDANDNARHDLDLLERFE